MKSDKTKTWKFAAIPTLIMVFLAFYPQLNIWLSKGFTLKGSYAVSNYDETAYSAYVNALINSRPRRNDPFNGKNNLLAESLYSVQIVPAHTIAVPARLLGISASMAFIILNLLIAAFSVLAIFALIRAVTGDNLTASVGSLTILCLGTAVVFQGQLQRWVLGTALSDFFLFLRRYQPGFGFPIFFVFCLLIWRLFITQDKSKWILYAILSGLTLAILVFTYFYLWTAAFAWLGCLTIVWLIGRKEERIKVLVKVTIVGLLGVGALVPYFLMLSNRAENMDGVNLMTFTRKPDLFALPEIFSLLLIALILYFVRKGSLRFNSPKVLLTLSILLTPFVLFNQQIITGRSLQSIHYELFIANYLFMTALILFISLVSQNLTAENSISKFRRVLLYLGIFAVIWGIIESTATARISAGFDSLREEAMPALNYIHQQEKIENLQSSALTSNQNYPAIFSYNPVIADFVSTVTLSPALWNPHTSSAGSISVAENKELFYRNLYYSDFDEKDLAKAIEENVFEVKAVLFGAERALPALSDSTQPITRQEVAAEVGKYAEFIKNFNAAKASEPTLSFVLVPSKDEPQLKNLELWYEHDEGKIFGLFKVYKVKLKSPTG